MDCFRCHLLDQILFFPDLKFYMETLLKVVFLTFTLRLTLEISELVFHKELSIAKFESIIGFSKKYDRNQS